MKLFCQFLGQAQLAAKGADLVLEKLAQHLDQLQHLFGQAADALWCDLIVTEGPPLNETLSITSG